MRYPRFLLANELKEAGNPSSTEARSSEYHMRMIGEVGTLT